MSVLIVFTQNVEISSLRGLIEKEDGEKLICVTTHYLFENERNTIKSFYSECHFYTFADFLTEKEMEKCDQSAYTSNKIDYQKYIGRIKKRKNQIVANKAIAVFKPNRKYILSDDLGIDIAVWKKHGFRQLTCEYYYKDCNKECHGNLFAYIKKVLRNNAFIKKLYLMISKRKTRHFYSQNEVSSCNFNGRKYIFIGNLSRVEYRFTTSFTPSIDDCTNLNNGIFEDKKICTYVTSWHERWKCQIPDNQKYDVRWTQDGYLPPNYTHKDYFFKPNNVKYYCWDYLGTLLFKNQGLPYEMIPFRKKIYLKQPHFPSCVKNVLVVASGSGDWTALKNRSDDDLLVDAFIQMARRYPSIKFVYRCHPTWVHPLNVGVNSINRVAQCFSELNLNNISISSNIPNAVNNGKYSFSFSRSSLKEDLNNADVVFGEHSISMIDAAMSGVPFASVNLTKRRNFFVGITNLGFPHCSSIADIVTCIDNVSDSDFQNNYQKAIDNYNKMTDMDV